MKIFEIAMKIIHCFVFKFCFYFETSAINRTLVDPFPNLRDFLSACIVHTYLYSKHSFSIIVDGLRASRARESASL